MLIGRGTTFIRKGSILANRAETAFIRKGTVIAHRVGHCIYQEWPVSLLIETDTEFIKKGIVLANSARQLIY